MKVIYFQVGRKETAQSWTLCQSSASQGEAGGKKSSVSFSVSFIQSASKEIHPAFPFTPNSTFTFTFNSIFTFIFLPFLQTNPHSLHPNHYLLLGLKEIVIQVGDTGWELETFVRVYSWINVFTAKITEADVLSETGKLARREADRGSRSQVTMQSIILRFKMLPRIFDIFISLSPQKPSVQWGGWGAWDGR